MNPHIDLIYFLSSLVMVVFPLGVFTWLTWLLIKKYHQEMREKGDGRST